MSRLKKFASIFAACSLLIAAPAHSNSFLDIPKEINQVLFLPKQALPWISERSSSVTLMGKSDVNPLGFFAYTTVGNSLDGIYRVFFNLGAENFSLCSTTLSTPDAMIFEIDGQPIKASVFCARDSDGSGLAYLQIVPATKEGLRFAIDKLKNSKGEVLIKFNGISWPVSSQNFASTHKKRAKNAL